MLCSHPARKMSCAVSMSAARADSAPVCVDACRASPRTGANWRATSPAAGAPARSRGPLVAGRAGTAGASKAL
eukprot:5600810-Pyramimonas_sp.AAC.1